MLRRTLTTAIAVLVLLPASAAALPKLMPEATVARLIGPLAPKQVITIVNSAGVQASVLARAEFAITSQSYTLRQHWGTPLVQFGPGGWSVYLMTDVSAYCGDDADGCHSQGPTGDVQAQVSVQVTGFPWTVVLSHEILEMLADPYIVTAPRYAGSTLVEVCDPVEFVPYTIDGVAVSDFVLPSWFQPRSQGPFDLQHVTRFPGDTSQGSAPD